MNKEKLNYLIKVSNNGEGKAFERGERRVLKAYYDSVIREGKEEIEFASTDGFFESELEDALNLMDEVQINSFTTYDSSSGLIHTIHYFLSNGWNVQPVEKKEEFGYTSKGLRFTR